MILAPAAFNVLSLKKHIFLRNVLLQNQEAQKW